jgi:hypothetical protein
MKKRSIIILLTFGLLIPLIAYADTDPIKPPKIWDLNKYGYPKNYYDMECIISPEMDVLKWLTTGEWADEYVEGEWDC